MESFLSIAMLVYSSMLKKSNEQTATRKKKTLTQKTSTFLLWRYFQWVSKNKPMHASEQPFLHFICMKSTHSLIKSD